MIKVHFSIKNFHSKYRSMLFSFFMIRARLGGPGPVEGRYTKQATAGGDQRITCGQHQE